MKIEHKRAGTKAIIMAIGVYLIVNAGNMMLEMMAGTRPITTNGILLSGLAGIFGLAIIYGKYYLTEKSLTAAAHKDELPPEKPSLDEDEDEEEDEIVRGYPLEDEEEDTEPTGVEDEDDDVEFEELGEDDDDE